MRGKLFGYVGAALVVALALILAACDLVTADARFNGRWLAPGGASIEFSVGAFTRTFQDGLVESGTYVADGGTITFFRPGYPPESMSYTLAFPRITIGSITYYRDAPVSPDDVQGFWMPFATVMSEDLGSPLIFGRARARTGNPTIMEGEFVRPAFFMGTYEISMRHLPDSGTIVTNTTHVSGSDFVAFLDQFLIAGMLVLFYRGDLEFEGDPGEWWMTLGEVRRIFHDALGRAAGDLAAQNAISDAMEFYLFTVGTRITYIYTLEKDPELNHIFYYVADGYNRLTLSYTDEHGWTTLFTFHKSTVEPGGGVPSNERWAAVWDSLPVGPNGRPIVRPPTRMAGGGR